MAKIDRRKEARGKECMVRIPGVCNFNPETTVLAHYRLAGYCGTGMKPHDDLASWCCSSCHDLIDGRAFKDIYTSESLKRLHAEGVMRTWMARKKI